LLIKTLNLNSVNKSIDFINFDCKLSSTRDYKKLWFVLFQTDERPSIGEDTTFVDYQTNLVRLAKQIARTAQEMVRRDSRAKVHLAQNLHNL